MASTTDKTDVLLQFIAENDFTEIEPEPEYSTYTAEDFRTMDSTEMIGATLNTFCSDSVVEIRCLGVDGRKNRTDSGYFDDFEKAARAVQHYVKDGSTRGVYFVLNPFAPELLARAENRFEQYATTTTADAAITSRRWLYVDGDPVRHSGISSTEQQVQYSIERTAEVAEWLMEQGFCEPVSAMSGNGSHLHFPVCLPNDADSLALVSGILATLKDKFSDDAVSIDTTVSNAARICRLYGTIARKGDSTADRQHRTARLLHVPDYIQLRRREFCSVEVLRAVAAMSEPQKTNGTPVASINAYTGSESRLMVPNYLRDAGIEFRETPGKDGFTNYVLACCPFNSDHRDPDSMVTQGSNGGVQFRCLHNSCKENRWDQLKAAFPPRPDHFDPPKNAVSRNKQSQYEQTDWKNPHQQHGGNSKPEEPIVVRSFAGIDASELSSYATQEPDWLVQDVFTIDEPLLVGARSKGCKTLQLTDLAVAVASGTQWMNAFDVPKQRKVLFISGETNRRRIAKHIEKACVARGIVFNDLAGFLRIEAVDFPCLPRLADQEGIRADIETHGIELVIVDPLYRGLSGIDSTRLSEMGDAIKSFQAACQPACMVLSHHVIKSAAREYGNPPQLEDMTGAGIAESCGQWWLVGRNEKYQWDWKHDLCVQFGGREGQGGGRRVLFNEHDWTFQVDAWHEYTEQAQADLQQQRDDARRDAQERKRATAQALIMKAMRNEKTPLSKNQIELNAGAVQADFRAAFAEMLREQVIVQRPYRDSRNRIQSSGFLLRDYVAEYDKSEMLVDVR